jgi:hypothetical protein
MCLSFSIGVIVCLLTGSMLAVVTGDEVDNSIIKSYMAFLDGYNIQEYEDVASIKQFVQIDSYITQAK